MTSAKTQWTGFPMIARWRQPRNSLRSLADQEEANNRWIDKGGNGVVHAHSAELGVRTLGHCVIEML
jgi:hypothetical protein